MAEYLCDVLAECLCDILAEYLAVILGHNIADILVYMTWQANHLLGEPTSNCVSNVEGDEGSRLDPTAGVACGEKMVA